MRDAQLSTSPPTPSPPRKGSPEKARGGEGIRIQEEGGSRAPPFLLKNLLPPAALDIRVHGPLMQGEGDRVGVRKEAWRETPWTPASPPGCEASIRGGDNDRV